MSHNNMTVLQFNAEHSVRQGFFYNSLDFDRFFFSHDSSTVLLKKYILIRAEDYLLRLRYLAGTICLSVFFKTYCFFYRKKLFF